VSDSFTFEKRAGEVYLKLPNIDPQSARQRRHDFLNAMQTLKIAADMIVNGYSFDGEGGPSRRKSLRDAVSQIANEANLIEACLDALSQTPTK